MYNKFSEALCVDSESVYLGVRLKEELPLFLYLPLHMPTPRCQGNKRLRTIMQWQHPFSPSTLILERNTCYLNRIITQGEKHGQWFSCEVCEFNLNAPPHFNFFFDKKKRFEGRLKLGFDGK